MTDGTLEVVLRRDRLVVAGALAIIAALAWAYVLWLAAHMVMPGSPLPDGAGGDMAGVDMSNVGGMDMGATVAPGFRAWALADFGGISPITQEPCLIWLRVCRASSYG